MKLRYLPIALSVMFSPFIAANAQVSVSLGLPGINIGINMPTYPQLVQVPGYPVYYDSRADANYFFYDGEYWVYEGDNWYTSTWYNGPWQEVGREYVPLFVLRVPVRYYRQPPAYFRGWGRNDAPRWGDHWGQSWSSQHQGWDRWNRNSIPAAAPLPIYQRKYSGARYPNTVTQQTTIRTHNYRYQPRDTATQRIWQHRASNPRAATQAHNANVRQQSNAQRAQAQQKQQAQQAQHQRAQAQKTQQRAQAQQTQQQRAQAQQRMKAQQTQQQRAQAQQTQQQRAQAQQRVKAQQTQQRGHAQQTQQRPQPQQTQQQRAQAQKTQQRAHAQPAKRVKPEDTRRTKPAPKHEDAKDHHDDHGH